jgi:hypothetical protein
VEVPNPGGADLEGVARAPSGSLMVMMQSGTPFFQYQFRQVTSTGTGRQDHRPQEGGRIV